MIHGSQIGVDTKEKRTHLVKVGDYMAQCPHCRNAVSYFGGTAKGTSTILKNFVRGDDKIYTCKNCNSNYRISLGSRLLLGVFIFCPIGFILKFITEIPAFIIGHVLIFIIAYGLILGYIWWRYFAQLEKAY